MQNKHGNNTYNKTLSEVLFMAKEELKTGNYDLTDSFLNIACNIIKKEKDINNESNAETGMERKRIHRRTRE